MEKVEYNDIVLLEFLDEIKATIRNSGFRLDYDRCFEVDKEMKKVIDDLHDSDSDIVKLYQKLDRVVDRRASHTLTYYYFAMYNDQLPLLKEILENNIGLFSSDDKFRFYLLDRDFTKYFDRDQYIFLMKYCRDELSNFYHKVFQQVSVGNNEERIILTRELNDISKELFSNHDLSEKEKNKLEKRLREIAEILKSNHHYKYRYEERDRWCSKVAEVMRLSPFICKKDDEDAVRDNYNIFSPEVLDLFSVEELTSLNDKEKSTISRYTTSPEILKRLKEFFKKYPEFNSSIHLTSDLISMFSDSELASLKEEDVTLYERASSQHVAYRYKKNLSNNPNLREYPHFIQQDVFDALSDEDISNLSRRAISKISNLVVHSKNFSEEERFHLVRSTVRIAKIDKIIQKVKKFFIVFDKVK